MNQFKKCNVVMLATNQKAQILKGSNAGNNLLLDNGDNINHSLVDGKRFQYQHLYITSDEEIKEDDYSVGDEGVFGPYEKGDILPSNSKRIIATTDNSLGLPQPSNQFIEKYIEEYNKGSVITDVLVEYIDNGEEGWSGSNEDGEPIWNEKIELKVNPKDNTITIKKVKESWNKEELLNTVNYWFEEPDTNIILNKINNWVISNL